jgi:hypothetical protein
MCEVQRNDVTSKSSIEQASQETPPEGFLGKYYLGKHRNGDPKGLLTGLDADLLAFGGSIFHSLSPQG